MNEALQIATLVFLAFVWARIGSVSNQIAGLKVGLDLLDERLQDIEERVRDNLMTDEERQREVDMQP